MKKNMLSVLLCICMVCTLLPATALAAEHSHNGWTALRKVLYRRAVLCSSCQI